MTLAQYAYVAGLLVLALALAVALRYRWHKKRPAPSAHQLLNW